MLRKQNKKLTSIDRRHLPEGVRRGLDEARHEAELDAVFFPKVFLVFLPHIHQIGHVTLQWGVTRGGAGRATSRRGRESQGAGFKRALKARSTKLASASTTKILKIQAPPPPATRSYKTVSWRNQNNARCGLIHPLLRGAMLISTHDDTKKTAIPLWLIFDSDYHVPPQ